MKEFLSTWLQVNILISHCPFNSFPGLLSALCGFTVHALLLAMNVSFLSHLAGLDAPSDGL